jgi:hypothetical protein
MTETPERRNNLQCRPTHQCAGRQNLAGLSTRGLVGDFLRTLFALLALDRQQHLALTWDALLALRRLPEERNAGFDAAISAVIRISVERSTPH